MCSRTWTSAARPASVISVRNLTVYGNKVIFPAEDFDGLKPSLCGAVAVFGQYYDSSSIFGNNWIPSALTPADYEPVRVNPSKISAITA